MFLFLYTLYTYLFYKLIHLLIDIWWYFQKHCFELLAFYFSLMYDLLHSFCGQLQDCGSRELLSSGLLHSRFVFRISILWEDNVLDILPSWAQTSFLTLFRYVSSPPPTFHYHIFYVTFISTVILFHPLPFHLLFSNFCSFFLLPFSLFPAVLYGFLLCPFFTNQTLLLSVSTLVLYRETTSTL